MKTMISILLFFQLCLIALSVGIIANGATPLITGINGALIVANVFLGAVNVKDLFS